MGCILCTHRRVFTGSPHTHPCGEIYHYPHRFAYAGVLTFGVTLLTRLSVRYQVSLVEPWIDCTPEIPNEI